MDNSYIAERIAQLRTQKNISAREMSLAIGQNESYINRIENHKALPSMQCFLYICEYFGITPQDFFNFDTSAPQKVNEIAKEAEKLTSAQAEHILQIIRDITNS